MSLQNITWPQVALFTVCLVASFAAHHYLGLEMGMAAGAVTALLAFFMGRGGPPSPPPPGGDSTSDTSRKVSGPLARHVLGLAVVFCMACKTNQPPDAGDVGAVLEAGAPVVNDVCDLLEGTDVNGSRSICATIEEIVQAVGYILTLRTDGAPPGTCQPLPRSAFCATSDERAKAVVFIVRVRQARLIREAGAP